MKVELTRRHHGVHDLVREAEIPGEFGDYATPRPDEVRDDEYTIDEDKLIAALPDGFLPEYVRHRVLLAVGDEDGGTGQSGLTRFRNRAKYFDAYCLTLVKPGPAPRICCGTAPGTGHRGTCERSVMRSGAFRDDDGGVRNG